MEKIVWKCTKEMFDRMDRDCMGVCLACGAAAYDCEPDARKYDCEGCSAKKVYGAQEAFLMGRLAIVEDKQFAEMDPAQVVKD